MAKSHAAATALAIIAAATLAGMSSAQEQSTTAAEPACRFASVIDAKNAWENATVFAWETIRVGFLETMQQDQRHGPGEPFFVDMDADRRVSNGDLSWSTDSKLGVTAGGRVTDAGSEGGPPLSMFDTVAIGWIEEQQDGVWTFGEKVVLDADSSGTLTPGDGFLSPPQVAGRQQGADGASGASPAPVAVRLLAGTVARIDIDASKTLTPADLVLWDYDDTGTVTAHDLCLEDVPRPAASPSPSPTSPSTRPTSPKPTAEPTSNQTTTARPSTTQKPGGFASEGGRFDGRYVSVVLDADAQTLANITIEGRLWFSQMQPNCPCQASVVTDDNGRATGLRVNTESGFLQISDQPTGLITFSVDPDRPVTWRLPPDATVAMAKEERLRIGLDDRNAWMVAYEQDRRSTAKATVEPDSDGTVVRLGGSGTFFVAQPQESEPLFTRQRETYQDAVLARKLAIEVHVLRTEFGNEPQVLNYENLDVRVSQPRDLEYELAVDADLDEGRSFVIQLPYSTMPVDEIEIRHQSETSPGVVQPTPIGRAFSLEDALDAQGGETPEFWIERDADGFQVTMSVPHFSLQLFQVVGIPPESAPLFAYGVVLVVLFIGLALTGVILGRWGRPGWRPPRQEMLPRSRGGVAAWLGTLARFASRRHGLVGIRTPVSGFEGRKSIR